MKRRILSDQRTIRTLRTIRVQYHKILLRSFGQEDFQRFTLNLLHSKFGYNFEDNASGATTSTLITHIQGILGYNVSEFC